MSTLEVWNEIKDLFFEQLKHQTKNPETLNLGSSVLAWFESGDMEEVEKNLQNYIHMTTRGSEEGDE